jgi:hypothetical protein
MALHAACALGDLAAVRRLIADGADVNGARDGGVRPIIAAALGGHAEVARALLTQGCDPAVCDAGGHTAAGIAKQRGDQTILRLLYASRSARLAGEIAMEVGNLEEERRLLREVEAAFSDDEDEAGSDSDNNDDEDEGDGNGGGGSGDSDSGGDNDNDNADDNDNDEPRRRERDDRSTPAGAHIVRVGCDAPDGAKEGPATEAQLVALLQRLQPLHVPPRTASLDRTGTSATDVLRGCDDDQLDDLRACMEGALSEVTAVQRDRRQRRDSQPAGFCQICVDQPTNSVFAPCGHVVACYTCATACDRCPICRGAIGQVVKTFFS